MPKLDAFSAQLVSLVRQMPDEALLALVKNQLAGVDAGAAAETTPKKVGARRTARRAKAKAPRGVRAPVTRGSNARRAALVEAVEKFVLGSKGVGLADVATAVGVSKDQAKSALKQLKAAGRIAYGGDRKYARYAADAKTALAASKSARAGK